MNSFLTRHRLFVHSMTLVLFGLVPLLSSARADDGLLQPTISVTGSAVVRVAPDEAVLKFSIESRDEQLDVAVADNEKKIKAVTDFLRQSKVQPANIRTQVISIRPIFEQPAPSKWSPAQSNLAADRLPTTGDDKAPSIQPIGFTVSRQLSITITDLDSFETVYSGLIKRGVNDVGGVDFRTTDLREHKDAARIQAVRAAKEKAVAMAGELEATVAGVHTITENRSDIYSGYAMQNRMMVAGEGSDETSVAAGMIEINATVSVVFRLGATGFEEK